MSRLIAGRPLAPIAFPVLSVAAWAVVVATVLPGVHPLSVGLGPGDSEHLALCAVTALGAVSCLWRAAANPGPDRIGWALVGLGLAVYAAGYAAGWAAGNETTSSPVGQTGMVGAHLSDWLSLSLYPLAFVGLLALSRNAREANCDEQISTGGPGGPGGPGGNEAVLEGRRAAGAVLDAAIVIAAFGSVVIAVVGSQHPHLLADGYVSAAYTLAYPIGSMALFAITLTVVAVRSWQLDGRSALLLIGFAALAAGDLIFAAHTGHGGHAGFAGFSGHAMNASGAAVVGSASGSPAIRSVLACTYGAGPVALGIAAWRRRGRAETEPSGSAVALAVPGLAVLVALTVLLVDNHHHLPSVAVALAGLAIAMSVGRTSMFLRQERRYERANRDSLTDDLTGLANRRALERLLTPRLAALQPTTLLLVDLDGFKEINDTLGHASGDDLLVGVARRLVDLGHSTLVARIGGDEFAIVLEEAVSPSAYAERVCLAIEAPLLVDGAVIAVGGSVGAATSVTDGSVASLSGELLRRADVAMYRAKQLRTRVEVWAPGLDVGTRERLEAMAALRAAVADPAQLIVHYQPQFDSRTRSVVGLEALARWQHPVRGLLLPADFLSAAEQAGLLPALTNRVLDASLSQLRRFSDAGKPIPVSVNVSAPDLLDLGFVDRVASALARHDVEPRLLRIEITETVAMIDPARVSTALERLHALGVGLSLDDYGTGLSSLAYLQSLPVDELKIDRSFVSRITRDPASAVIVASTIDLAHALQLAVVAEGVEDEATFEVLRNASCDSIQGFLLSEPMPADDLGLDRVTAT